MATEWLQDKGLVEFDVLLRSGRPTMHFRLDQKVLTMQIANIIFEETKDLMKQLGTDRTMPDNVKKRFLEIMKEKGH
ncbi:MAG: hypothetical protein WA003_12475 [Desulfuromonadaceae bacterium]